MEERENVFIYEHPLIQDKLRLLRNKNTKPELFRILMKEITSLMGYEVTKDLPLRDTIIDTPITSTNAKRIAGKTPFLVIILRAGDGMKEGMLELLPTARVGFIGLYRKEGGKRIGKEPREKVEIEVYYNKLPIDAKNRQAIILDPMLATGSSASIAISITKKAGAKNIKFMSIVACEEGINKVTTDHPDVKFFCAAVDKHLLSNNYISPGLGDAGDRLYSIK